MGKLTRRLMLLFLLGVIFALPGLLWAQGKTGLAGSESCVACHQDANQSYLQSIHGNKAVPGSPAARLGCESCHGQGTTHVEKSGARTPELISFGARRANVSRANASCLSCHSSDKNLALWQTGKHKNVACDSCHSVHSTAKNNLKKKEPELCYDCHKDIRAQVNRRSHHPIKEGKVSCSSCHDSHGTFGRKLVKADTNNELCYKCHSDKRGPFMFEHAPVEENCMNCHTPHGSNQAKLLIRKTPQLCQSCHNWTRHPGTPYTAFETFRGTSVSNKAIARDCMNCHGNIHGSNAPSTRGLRFVR